MVTDAILDWWFGLVGWLLDLLPTNQMPGGTMTLSMMGQLNYFLPITEMFQLFASMFALGGVFASSSLVIWVLLGIIRGGQTKA